MAEDIIKKIKQAGLHGRSGSGFPTWLKWEAVEKSKANKKYVICNASEGEPRVFKDRYILEKFPEKVMEGIKIALRTLEADSAYIYINKDYYAAFKEKLTKFAQNLPIELFKKPGGYLCGEETVLLNIIEGKRPVPRIKPPFPTECGLWGKPTLINNVETFYRVAEIAKGEYKGQRFYSITGATENKGVFELPEAMDIKQILKKTNNLPRFEFFLQAGGGAGGEILLSDELEGPVKGLGSIIVFDKRKTNPLQLMKEWAYFFLKENCDKCTPCREGIYRLTKILEEKTAPSSLKNQDKKTIKDIFFVLEKTSLCSLGRIAVPSFKTAIEKLL